MSTWSDEMTSAEVRSIAASWADAARRRGLAVPLQFLLEAHRPLAWSLSQGLIVAAPLIGPLVGPDRALRAARFLREPGAIDEVLALLDHVDSSGNGNGGP